MPEITIPEERRMSPDSPLTEEEKGLLRSACGRILWATSQTRPDVSFEACQVSNYGANSTVRSLMEANKAIQKIRSNKLKFVYPCLGYPQNISVAVFGDGSHASLPSGASQGANIVFLVGGGRSASISWQSKKLDRVTKSPLATEVSAAADAADHGHLVASMVKELYNTDKLPKIELFTDSKSLKEHLETSKVISDPRLRVDVARLREMREIGEVAVQWVKSHQQLADCLTKRGAASDRLRHVLATGVLTGC